MTNHKNTIGISEIMRALAIKRNQADREWEHTRSKER